MAATDYTLNEEDMAVDEGFGYPKAYAKLCRDGAVGGACSLGPPSTFTPYSLQKDEILRARELDKLFPVIDPRAKQTAKPKIFASLLWKQLNHLGNAGFDPTVIRVDQYGNVLYFHADKASPLAWDIDHWFPCPRGGLTVPSNLRILQWQVCKRKHNKLEFLVPWWDLQLGISVNQFLSIFASSNSDFRHRAFSFLFSEGENEELNASQTVESHSFPQHFIESKEQLGLAPAAIVISRREPYVSSLALKSLDYNRQIRPPPPIAAQKVKPRTLKENENPDFVANPYQAIVMARDSLKQREESQKMQAEIQKLDMEVNEMKQMNEEEKLTIQDLELTLMKRRRRAEKCRKLAEAQSSYRTMLEKMIRDAMHQSVMYKEQVRLNQAATNALIARLEAQKAICDASEKELHKKFNQRDELERQIRPEWEQARKRSRMDDALSHDRDSKTVLYLPGIRPRTPLHKELRAFLEEEHKTSQAGLSANEETEQAEIEKELKILAKSTPRGESDQNKKSIIAFEREISIVHELEALHIDERKGNRIQYPAVREQEIVEDEETRKERGKGNVERWLQMLLDNSQEEIEPENSNGYETGRTDDIIRKMNEKFPQKEAETSKRSESNQVEKDKGTGEEDISDTEANKMLLGKENAGDEGIGSKKSFETNERTENKKEKVIARSESARTLRHIPSSPSLILRKGVECMRKKPIVADDDDYNEFPGTGSSFIKSSMKTIKNAVKM